MYFYALLLDKTQKITYEKKHSNYGNHGNRRHSNE